MLYKRRFASKKKEEIYVTISKWRLLKLTTILREIEFHSSNIHLYLALQFNDTN